MTLALALAGCSSEAPLGTEGGQWRSYAGDPQSTKYSALDQIDAGNASELGIAWRWESAAAAFKRDVLDYAAKGRVPWMVSDRITIADFQGTPLMIDGALYGITSVGQVFSLDAATGEQRWLFDPESYRSATGFFDFLFPKHRGVAYWRDGDDARIVVATMDAYLMALDTRTGKPISSFGLAGRVDLLKGLRNLKNIRRLNDYFQTSPPAIYRDLVILGGTVTDRPKGPRSIPGDIRAYDARTGDLVWTFHTVPARGEPGTETWEKGSWRHSGGANAWGPMTVDPELGRVYVTTSTPTNDFYGGHRLGDNLYAETLLCLDAQTGERLWHFQLVRHGLWDYDPGAAANLVDITVDGRTIQAVAQVTKQAFAFVFDRVTGEPVWPIEDRPVPRSDIPGERAAATQPFPTKPPPYDRQGTFEEDLIDLTPELRAEALEVFRRFRTGPLFTPPTVDGSLILPGPPGGSNWRGAGVDPETGTLFVTSITQASVISAMPSDPDKSGFRYETDLSNPQFAPGGNYTPDSLPLFKPPFSRITAIDLNRGEIAWQVPNGNGPRDHPRLRHLDLPPLGSGAPTCVLVTKSLLFAGGGAELWIPTLGEPIFRAYDKATGAVVGEIELPAKVRGCPMTYLQDGIQYIVLPIADDDHDPELIALALPRS